MSPRACRIPRTFAVVALAAAMPLVTPMPILGQQGSDREELLDEALDKQRDFELFRASRIPPERRDAAFASCDAQMGRICVWFGGSDEVDFPEEPPETNDARRGLIGLLLETREQVPDDPWLTGMLVHYLVEQGDPRYAERIATECGLDASWWCSALHGYSLQIRGATMAAEQAFREALDAMPDDEWRWWTLPRWILPPEEVDRFEAMTDGDLAREVELLWRLSDPLFLVEGNDRFTEHMARLVEVRNYEESGNPYFMDWDVDMAESLVRYGRAIGYSRIHNQGFGSIGELRDTRRVVGHHDPASRGYLFPDEFLVSPSDVPPESWITAPREARTWWAPAYAPDFRALESQVARFRRDDEMLVVAAYRPSSTGPMGLENPFEETPGEVESALVLVPEAGGPTVRITGSEPRGVLTLRSSPGRWVSSIEVYDSLGNRAWRARQGVKQTPLEPGGLDISDLMILEAGAPLPDSFDEALPHVRPGIRVRQGERFPLVWEVYGLRVAQPVTVTVGFTRGRPGFLARVGAFLGVLEPDRPVEVTFTDEGADVQSAFRSMMLELPDVEPGEYTLHVRLAMPGREPIVASRPIVVEQ